MTSKAKSAFTGFAIAMAVAVICVAWVVYLLVITLSSPDTDGLLGRIIGIVTSALVASWAIRESVTRFRKIDHDPHQNQNHRCLR